MPLPENEKDEFEAQSALADRAIANVDKVLAADVLEQTMLNVDLNEPEAWLEALRRVADRKAKELAKGLMNDEQASKRWRKLATALETTQANLDAQTNRQSPD
jgi:autotransporter translocation and assembly factor TamB